MQAGLQGPQPTGGRKPGGPARAVAVARKGIAAAGLRATMSATCHCSWSERTEDNGRRGADCFRDTLSSQPLMTKRLKPVGGRDARPNRHRAFGEGMSPLILGIASKTTTTIRRPQALTRAASRLFFPNCTSRSTASRLAPGDGVRCLIGESTPRGFFGQLFSSIERKSGHNRSIRAYGSHLVSLR